VAIDGTTWRSAPAGHQAGAYGASLVCVLAARRSEGTRFRRSRIPERVPAR
jgi:hypothetical protein